MTLEIDFSRRKIWLVENVPSSFSKTICRWQLPSIPLIEFSEVTDGIEFEWSVLFQLRANTFFTHINSRVRLFLSSIFSNFIPELKIHIPKFVSVTKICRHFINLSPSMYMFSNHLLISLDIRVLAALTSFRIWKLSGTISCYATNLTRRSRH